MPKTSPRKRAPRAREATRTRTADRETAQRILDAARAVFIRRGTAGARMQEIAAEAGVNQALLHYYFRSKESLSAAVFGQLASRLFPALIQTLGSDATIDAKIDSIVALYLENLSKNPFLPGYLISELHHHPERVQQMLVTATGADPTVELSRVFRKLGRQIDDAVKAGRMRPIEPEQFAANLLSLCVFPFAARPMLAMVFQMDDAAFARFIDRRKAELPQFFRNALRP
ncbi:MAG TPA: helix-turn-helix domain-containing protein [Gemmatimonadaceae bacterium]|nr:helix-turn-helix domain-containing protein [Gemmatimonadaceae bacterium]